MKPILGLLVLLAWPCLGWDGRADAGFARGVTTLSPKHSLVDPLGDPDPLLNREADTSSDMAPPVKDGNGPPVPAPTKPRDLLHLSGCTLGGGMSSRGGPSTPTGGGTTPPFVPPFTYQVPSADPSGLLPPHDEGIDLPRSASRLFRPPRGV